MENSSKQISDNPINAIKAMMILNAFKSLCEKANGYNLVPLKGVSLLSTIYSERLDREVSDIDLLVFPREKADKLFQQLIEDGYKTEFPMALQKDALNSKLKASMLSPSSTLPNVDVHIALVTKKFFSRSIGTFNDDAIERATHINGALYKLDPIDEWLFLAQHAAFHLFTNVKWLIDLELLLRGFDEKQVDSLLERSRQYGFDRVVGAAKHHLARLNGDNVKWINRLPETKGLFAKYVRHCDRPLNTKNKWHKILIDYFEFMCIDSLPKRIKAFASLIFPSIGKMKNIYRSTSTILMCLMYPIHILVMSLISLIFACYYLTGFLRR